jgi:hypothetical protein
MVVLKKTISFVIVLQKNNKPKLYLNTAYGESLPTSA